MTVTENKNIYFVIPTINGEIFGNPYIVTEKETLNYIEEEVTIYKINFISYKSIEIEVTDYDK